MDSELKYDTLWHGLENRKRIFAYNLMYIQQFLMKQGLKAAYLLPVIPAFLPLPASFDAKNTLVLLL